MIRCVKIVDKIERVPADAIVARLDGGKYLVFLGLDGCLDEGGYPVLRLLKPPDKAVEPGRA